MTFLSAVNTLPEGFAGENIDAAIHFAPAGKPLVEKKPDVDKAAPVDQEKIVAGEK